MTAPRPANWRAGYRGKRARDAGSVKALQRRVWFCIETVDRQMREAVEDGDVDTTLRCSNALNLLGGTYFRMVQGDAQEARIKELERIVQQGRAAKVSASEYFGWKVNGDAK